MTGVLDRIHEQLARIEREEEVSILYACESGSRAWGFESADSDYDVRFLYLRRTERYLSVHPPRDVIEVPIEDDLDVSGWDLPKALRLFEKSNPPLLEWLQSPIVYVRASRFAERLAGRMVTFHSPASCHDHYLHMAEGNLRSSLRGEVVRTKKHLYVLRPVLACIWIERGYGVVPMEFGKLVDRVVDDPALRREIEDLLVRKRAGGELGEGPRNPVLSGFLESELERLRATSRIEARRGEPAELDRLFLETLVEVNGAGLA